MHLIIIAGEVSGDKHGAKLIAELKSQNPQMILSGIGGDEMIRHGFKAKYHIRDMAFLGIGEIIRHLPFIRKVFKNLVEHVKTVKPEAVVLIDYPGFNLRFAKALHKISIPVIYYISPQLWAWGKRRVHKVKKYVDLMLVVFPFEVDFYQKYGVPAKYVGHPLVDEHFNKVKPKTSATNNDKTLGLLPGSRKHEISQLLPDMLKTAKRLLAENKIGKVIIAKVDHIDQEFYKSLLKGNSGFVSIFNGKVSDFYNALDVALVKSGTSTLETAFYQVPFVIVYRVSKLTWFLGNLLVKLDVIGLANIVAGKKVARELLQNDFTPEKATLVITELLEPKNNQIKREEIKIIQEKLGEQGASKRAAKNILDFISKSSNYKNDPL